MDCALLNQGTHRDMQGTLCHSAAVNCTLVVMRCSIISGCFLKHFQKTSLFLEAFFQAKDEAYVPIGINECRVKYADGAHQSWLPAILKINQSQLFHEIWHNKATTHSKAGGVEILMINTIALLMVA